MIRFFSDFLIGWYILLVFIKYIVGFFFGIYYVEFRFIMWLVLLFIFEYSDVRYFC